MIHIENLIKRFNQQIAINIHLLNINKGEIVGLVGNNGAGKTTLLRLIINLSNMDSGNVLIEKKSVLNSSEWKSFTAAFLDERFLINYLTVSEYFYFVGKLHNLQKSQVDKLLEPLLPFFDGTNFADKYIRELSKGNQFKVGITACLILQPKLLLLDEPFANLDPRSQITLKNILSRLNERLQTTILISSHDLNHITSLCQRILVLEKGEIKKDINSAGASNILIELETYFKV